jgi:hypothetical protein
MREERGVNIWKGVWTPLVARGLMQPARLPLGVPPSGTYSEYACCKQVRYLLTVVIRKVEFWLRFEFLNVVKISILFF